jgi:hypothetical protein
VKYSIQVNEGYVIGQNIYPSSQQLAATSDNMITAISLKLLQGFSYIVDELENYWSVVTLRHYVQAIYDAYAKANLMVKCFEEIRFVCSLIRKFANQ